MASTPHEDELEEVILTHRGPHWRGKLLREHDDCIVLEGATAFEPGNLEPLRGYPPVAFQVQMVNGHPVGTLGEVRIYRSNIATWWRTPRPLHLLTPTT